MALLPKKISKKSKLSFSYRGEGPSSSSSAALPDHVLPRRPCRHPGALRAEAVVALVGSRHAALLLLLLRIIVQLLLLVLADHFIVLLLLFGQLPVPVVVLRSSLLPRLFLTASSTSSLLEHGVRVDFSQGVRDLHREGMEEGEEGGGQREGIQQAGDIRNSSPPLRPVLSCSQVSSRLGRGYFHHDEKREEEGSLKKFVHSLFLFMRTQVVLLLILGRGHASLHPCVPPEKGGGKFIRPFPSLQVSGRKKLYGWLPPRTHSRHFFFSSPPANFSFLSHSVAAASDRRFLPTAARTGQNGGGENRLGKGARERRRRTEQARRQPAQAPFFVRRRRGGMSSERLLGGENLFSFSISPERRKEASAGGGGAPRDSTHASASCAQ